MSNYAILRTAKLKTNGNIGGASAHNTRTMHVPGLAADRTKLNKVMGAQNAVKGVQDRINAIYKDSGKEPRKNAVRAVETLLTASPEFFDQLAPRWRDGKLGKINDWFKDNLKFIRDTWGKDNIIQVALHLDEKTPHIQVITVPEKDGKLNCRAILGGKPKLSKMQDNYAKAMAKYGLERGIEKSNSHHIPISTYHGSQQQILDSIPKAENMLQFVGMEKSVFKSAPKTKERRVIVWNQQNKDAIDALANMANAAFINDEMARRARERLDQADEEYETRETLSDQLEAVKNDLINARLANADMVRDYNELRAKNEQLEQSVRSLEARLSKYEDLTPKQPEKLSDKLSALRKNNDSVKHKPK